MATDHGYLDASASLSSTSLHPPLAAVAAASRLCRKSLHVRLSLPAELLAAEGIWDAHCCLAEIYAHAVDPRRPLLRAYVWIDGVSADPLLGGPLHRGADEGDDHAYFATDGTPDGIVDGVDASSAGRTAGRVDLDACNASRSAAGLAPLRPLPVPPSPPATVPRTSCPWPPSLLADPAPAVATGGSFDQLHAGHLLLLSTTLLLARTRAEVAIADTASAPGMRELAAAKEAAAHIQPAEVRAAAALEFALRFRPGIPTAVPVCVDMAFAAVEARYFLCTAESRGTIAKQAPERRAAGLEPFVGVECLVIAPGRVMHGIADAAELKGGKWGATVIRRHLEAGAAGAGSGGGAGGTEPGARGEAQP
ncbi:hypothetical protein DFJ74DRAFT_701610 [Hyaloraphidium curvatum]|nr:hypothetical protein DFJ74DRAFT_701610 [Hyaloraphidium curvatum]